MSHNHGTGYKGFRSWSVQPCSHLKPGETIQGRDSKFRNVGHGMVYASPAPTNRTPYSSINHLKLSSVQPNHYKIPDRRGVAAGSDKRDSSTRSKPFIATTTAANSYPNYVMELLGLKTTSTEQFLEAFDRVDTDNSGFISITEVQALLKDAYKGKQPSKREVDKFVKFFDKNQDGRITKEEFVGGLSRVRALLEQDTKTGAGRMVEPGWKKSQTLPRKILKASTQKSSYQADVGTYGEDPMNRPFQEKTGMKSTTGDLNLGTTKDTYRVPGYAGFLPSAKTNADAASQGDGKNPRSRGEDLRLYHNHNLPGYTGHNPVDCYNDYGARQSGCDCRTSSGAAAMGM